MNILQLIYLFLIARHSEVFHFVPITNSATRHKLLYIFLCTCGGEYIQGTDLEVQLVCVSGHVHLPLHKILQSSIQSASSNLNACLQCTEAPISLHQGDNVVFTHSNIVPTQRE